MTVPFDKRQYDEHRREEARSKLRAALHSIPANSRDAGAE